MTETTFSDFGLSAPLLQAIEDLEYKTPSPIQAATLPILLGEPTDFLGLAATGTGKTAAFGIPMLEKIDPQLRAVQTLILCPTRELALQVCGQINLLGKHKRVRAAAVYGGAPYGEQIAAFRSGVAVIVGTPGRIVDHVEKGTLRLDDLKLLILDEADEMISMGFKEDLEKILALVPKEQAQTWLFSATMSREVRKVADDYLRKPKQVQVNREEMLSTGVEQYYYPTQEHDKPEVLCKLIEAAEDFYGIVFCQTKALVVDLTAYLTERGYKVDCLHGDKDQTARERTMLAFRNRKVNVLICTDVASRGLDVKDITHVINYSLPRELDNYVHRIGRTARSGKTGVAMNLVTFSHRRLIVAIENLTKSRMKEGKLPTRREIATKKVTRQLEDFNKQTFHDRAVEVMTEEWKTALAGMTAEEVAGRFLNMMMPEIFNEREIRVPSFSPRAAAPARESGGYQARGGDRPQRSYGRDDRKSEYGDRPQRSHDRRQNELGDSAPVRSPFDRSDRVSGPSASRPSASSSRPSFGGERTSRPAAAPSFERSERSAPTDNGGERPMARPARPVPPYVRTKQMGAVAAATAGGPNRKARRAQAFAAGTEIAGSSSGQ